MANSGSRFKQINNLQRLVSNSGDQSHSGPPVCANAPNGGASSFAPLGQARATVAMTMMAACYNLKRVAKFLDDGVDAFYKACSSKSEVCLEGVKA